MVPSPQGISKKSKGNNFAEGSSQLPRRDEINPVSCRAVPYRTVSYRTSRFLRQRLTIMSESWMLR